MNNLPKRLLDNPGLVALTVEAERQEIKIIPPSVACAMAEARKHKIVFAFFQSDFKGGKIPYWHVCDPTHKSYHSTLSMQGLREWGVL